MCGNFSASIKKQQVVRFFNHLSSRFYISNFMPIYLMIGWKKKLAEVAYETVVFTLL